MQSWPPVTSGCVDIAGDTGGRSPSLRLPLARLLELLMILQTERYPNARRLAEACAVSRRTIYRDLATLEAAGIQVVYCSERQGYQLARDCLLQPLQLDDYEALALLIMIRCSQSDEPFGLARHARSGLAKVVGALPQQLRSRITRCGEVLPEGSAPAAASEPTRQAIHQAILSALLHRKTIRIRSRDPRTGEAITTDLAAYRIARVAGEWSLVGYSSVHGGVQVFDLGRVENAEPTDETYTIPPRFRLERSGFGEDNQEHSNRCHDVQLRVKPPAAFMIQSAPLGEIWRTTSEPSGELELSLTIDMSERTVCWILGFGDQVEVIRPPELREAVREHAVRIARLHDSSTR